MGLLAFPVLLAGIIFLGSPQPYQYWADIAKVPTAPVEEVLILKECPDFPKRSCVYYDSPYTIWLLPKAGRGELYHEMGHVYDFTVLTDKQRHKFGELLGDFRSWRDSPNALNEEFAEAYRLCALGPGQFTFNGHMLGGYGYNPTALIHRRICNLIREGIYKG